ncbi:MULTISPECIES: CoA pyrophosphatase [unclassified Shewanella]|uniref:CoA pyrophosphatase n=1 Tax=unclassified Shewanella TaxID=196818 RepID=UPI001BBC323A|nr:MULTISPECIES: CoA pyrophosphatase [unclassified Shewanella]GIU11059.1 coenzyme A pyrophosphatase [Shewanella sp. MBTL60-112-B1]GIU39914.1 coenzyme A pyrophosphatase [Shewanella sp. MBTL60-112-B2]
MKLAEFRLRYNLNTLPELDLINLSQELSKELRKAAVLIALYEVDNELELILTRRPTHLRAHPGQISFPGGKVEASDSSYQITALREAEEEIGLQRSNVEIIGSLPAHKTFTGFEITPFVGIVKQTFRPVLDPGEVDEYFTVPLSYLLKQYHRHTQRFSRKGIEYPVHFIPYQEYFIWGATAAMIDLLCRQVSANPVRS